MEQTNVLGLLVCGKWAGASGPGLSGSWGGRVLKEAPLGALPPATGDVKAGRYTLSGPEGSLSPLSIRPHKLMPLLHSCRRVLPPAPSPPNPLLTRTTYHMEPTLWDP